MTYPPAPRRASRPPRSPLDSPWLSALLVVIVLGLVVAIVAAPGLIGSPSPSAPGPNSTQPAPTPAGPSSGPTFVRPTPSPAPSFVTYRVQSGDSLNSIAKKFRTTARSIAWWNRGAYPRLDPESANYDPNTIRVGWVLVVLPDSVVDDNNPPTPSPGPTGAPTPDSSG